MISHKQFTWSPETRSFVAEASDLGLPPGFTIDGITVLQANGIQSVWQLDKVLRDMENDVQGWRFLPTADTLRQDSELEGISLVIFND